LKKINPIWLLIAFNVLLFVFRDWILPAGATEHFGASIETLLASLGAIGYIGVVAIYSIFLGAGLVESDSANEFAIYLAVPLLLLGVISLLLRHFNKRYGTS
jgi:hypothetical protein